jgi:hypothetical protein
MHKPEKKESAISAIAEEDILGFSARDLRFTTRGGGGSHRTGCGGGTLGVPRDPDSLHG